MKSQGSAGHTNSQMLARLQLEAVPASGVKDEHLPATFLHDQRESRRVSGPAPSHMHLGAQR